MLPQTGSLTYTSSIKPFQTKHFKYVNELAVSAEDINQMVENTLEQTLLNLFYYYMKTTLKRNPLKPQVSAFHLRFREINYTLNGSK